jgi:glycosyltransferase A (GT-A) superfamily protein (DUF2064 family)
MADYTITGRVTAANINSLKARLAKALGDIDAQNVRVELIDKSPSRADRLSKAQALIEEAASIVSDLQEEMQNWYDNMPESLQGGDKASAVEECANNLEEIKDALEQIDCSNVEFPGMFG